jgi:hypothetical protein
MALTLSSDKETAVTAQDSEPPTTLVAPEIAVVEELSPLSLHESQGVVAEATFRAVAPLVIVLTFATFLNVSYLLS